MTQPYYQDDAVTLYHGDCFGLECWKEADALVTDPPYGMFYKSGWSGATVLNDHNEAVRNEFLRLWFLTGDRPALVFGRWSVPRPYGTRAVLTWDKGDWPGMGDLALPWGPSTEEVYVLGKGFSGKRAGSVLRVAERPNGTTALHPSQKPVSLLMRLIKACPGGTVADPFAGSGTTLVAAKNLGRRAIGSEIDERYCETAAKRLSQEVLNLEVSA